MTQTGRSTQKAHTHSLSLTHQEVTQWSTNPTVSFAAPNEQVRSALKTFLQLMTLLQGGGCGLPWEKR